MVTRYHNTIKVFFVAQRTQAFRPRIGDQKIDRLPIPPPRAPLSGPLRRCASAEGQAPVLSATAGCSTAPKKWLPRAGLEPGTHGLTGCVQDWPRPRKDDRNAKLRKPIAADLQLRRGG